MSIFRAILIKLGLANLDAQRDPIAIFLLDDDKRRHQWFEKRFAGDNLTIAETVDEAKELLPKGNYDAIFLDHDLLPHHYVSDTHDDFHKTGYEIARWLSKNREIQPSATIIVHTRNSDAAVRMIEKLVESGRQAEYVAFPYLGHKIKNYWGK